MEVKLTISLWAALFTAVTLAFFQPVSAQSKPGESVLLQGSKWPYEKPIFQNGKSYGRFHFSEGLAKVSLQQQVGFVDSSYTLVIPLAYEDTRDAERYASAVVVDRVTELHYQDAYMFRNSRAIVQQNGKWGVIDPLGNTVVPLQYLYIHRLLDTYFQVHQTNEFDYIISGILDLDGAIVLPVQYAWPATPFSSKAELLAEKRKAAEAESRKKQLPITETQATEMARKAGFYKQNHWLHPPQVSATPSGQWQISSLLVGYTKAGKCKYTNGCTTTERKTMLIDGATGKVLDKIVSKAEIPNYEQ